MPPLAFIQTPDGPIRYAQAGEGPDVVLIHGAMTSVEDMVLGPFDALAQRFRVTAFDRPGYGATTRERLRGAPSSQAAHLLAAMHALDLGAAVVIGHSFGGAVAMAMALSAPERLGGVLAISPIVFPELRLEHLLFGARAIPFAGEAIGYGPGRWMDAALLPILWPAMFAPQIMPPRFAAHYPFALASRPGPMLALGEEAVLALPDLAANAPRYRACKVPVEVFAGSRDWVTPPWGQATGLARAVPGAKLTVLPGLGHMVHHFAAHDVVEAATRLAS